MWRVGDEPVPGYRLEAFLGEGSNAVVWRATAPGRTAVALKLINLGGRLGLKEFRGVQRVKEIRHAHLLPITAFWILDDQGCVMDDHALESLDDRAHGRETDIKGTLQVEVRWPKTLVVAMLLGEKNLLEHLEWHQKAGNEGIPVEELLDYMEDAAKGIDYLNSPCHDLGSGPAAIQHCDIKPQNIMLVGNSAMVCDFGLARVLGGGGNYRTITGPVGTPAYVAPECIQGAVPSWATDQYSLAITYCELRTGRLPFAGESLMDVYEAHSSGKLDLDRLSVGEREVIRRATSVRPEERYPSTLEMVRTLRRAVEQQHASASAAETSRSAPMVSPPPLPSAAPQQAEGSNSPVAASQGEIVGEAKLVLQSASDRKPEMDSFPGGPGPRQRQTYAVRFEPENVEVTINGIRQQLDAEGSVAVQGRADTPLEIFAAAIGYEAFRETVTIAQLGLLSYNIRLRRDARYLVEQGMANLRQGDVEAAIADFDEAIELAPELAEAYYGRAMAHGATVEYLRDYADAFNKQAHTHFAKGEYHRAITDFTEAIRINPELAQAHHCRLLRNRAVAYRNQGNYDQAVADYNQVIGFNPDFARAYHDRAMVHHAKGDYDKAIDDYAKAIRLMPGEGNADYNRDYASAYRERGDAHYQNGDCDKALADYNEAVRIQPDWGVVYNQRGRLYGGKGDYDKAIADYTRSIQLDPDFAYVYFYNRGSAHYKNGEYNKAIADFTTAIERIPGYGNAYRYRGHAYEKIGMEAKAEADLAKAESLDGHDNSSAPYPSD